MRTKFTIFIAAALFSVVCPAAASAQDVAGSSAALPFLNSSADSRSLGMGGLVTTESAGAYAHMGNAAAVPFSDKKVSAGFSYGLWQPTSVKGNIFSIGAMWNINDKFGVTFATLTQSGQKYDITDEAGVPTGTFRPNDFRIGAGFAYRFIENMSVGISLNYAQSSVAPKNEMYKTIFSTFAADIQVRYVLDKFNISLTGSNLGVPVKSASGISSQLPMNARIGGGYGNDFGKHHLSAGIEGGVFFGGPAAGFASAGAEYMYNSLLAVRAGYHYGSKSNGIPSFASVGIGVQFFGINIDAAYLIATGASPMKNTLSVGIGYSF